MSPIDTRVSRFCDDGEAVVKITRFVSASASDVDQFADALLAQGPAVKQSSCFSQKLAGASVVGSQFIDWFAGQEEAAMLLVDDQTGNSARRLLYLLDLV